MLNYPGICKLGIASISQIPFHICKKLTLIYIVSGRLQFSTVAGKQTLYEGQLEILNVKEPVMMEAENDSCRVLYFCFDDKLLQCTNMNFEWVTYNCNICNFFGAAAKKEYIDSLAALLLYFALDARKGISAADAHEKAMNLLHYIMEHFDDVGHIFSENEQENISKERFQRISSYMIANVTNKISLKDIAQSEYLSIPYLSREFTAKLEKNFHTIVNYYRTINAVIQLLDTDYTLTYIAETSGFSSIRYYNQVFSSFLGCPPSKFRSVYKGKPQEVTEENWDIEELQKIVSSLGKQTGQTNIKISLAQDGQQIKRFTYHGNHEDAKTYTFTLEGASGLEKGVILYIDDSLNQHVESMAAAALLKQSPYLQKLIGTRREVWHLTAAESEVKAVVCGKWTIELYVIL